MPKIDIKLHDQQFDFYESPSPFNALLTGRGFGKTFVHAYKAITRLCEGSRGLLVAPTYTMLEDVLWAETMKLLSKFKIPFTKNTRNMIITVGGRPLYFRSANRPDRIRGLQYGFFGIDEGGQLRDDEVWKIALGGCRDKSPEGWVTSTPNGFNWLYDKFGRPDIDRSMYNLFHGHSGQNPHNPKEFFEILKQEYAGAYLDQEVYGAFTSMEGQIFSLENMRFYQDDLLQTPGFFDNCTLCGYLDPATGSKTGDYHAFITGMLHRSGAIYILDAVVDKLDDSRMIDVFSNAIARWSYQQIGVESLFWQKKYVFDILTNKFPAFPFSEMSTKHEKHARIAGIQPLVENKMFFPEKWIHERNTDGRRVLDQLFQFNLQGKYKHDDAPDAIEGLTRMFRAFNPKTKSTGGGKIIQQENTW